MEEGASPGPLFAKNQGTPGALPVQLHDLSCPPAGSAARCRSGNRDISMDIERTRPKTIAGFENQPDNRYQRHLSQVFAEPHLVRDTRRACTTDMSHEIGDMNQSPVTLTQVSARRTVIMEILTFLTIPGYRIDPKLGLPLEHVQPAH